MAWSYIAPPFREAPFLRVLCHRVESSALRRSRSRRSARLQRRAHRSVKARDRTAVFDAAYGNARVRSSDAIDENTAGVEIARDFASQPDVSGPEIAAQTELACIRRTNRRINVWNAG